MADANQDDAELDTEARDQDSDQLEEPKSTKDTETDTEGELFEDEPKSDDTDLDLEVDDKKKKDTKSARENAAEKQKQAWLLKIIQEEAAVKDAPKWLQVSLATELKAIEKATNVDVDAKIEEKLKAREEHVAFNNLRAELNNLNLTEEQRSELSIEYKDLVGSGVSKLKSLEKAIKISGIEMDNSSLDLRRSMQLPKGGTPPQETKYDTPEEIAKIPSSKERAKHWEAMIKNRKTLPY